MKTERNLNSFNVTDEDEEAVAAKLQEFVIPVREEPKVYQPIIFENELIEVKPIEKPVEELEERLIPPKPKRRKGKKDYFILQVSSSYYDSNLKKFIDFILGFCIIFLFYFLMYQPLLIFLIYMFGMVQAAWAFRAKRLFIVWGFIFGTIFSIFIALLIYAMNPI
jgi:hypothetical protein